MPDVPADDFDTASKSSSIKAWCDGQPGQGCSMDELRWFVIREIGGLKRTVSTIERESEKQAMTMDVIKGKTREKLNGDQVNAKVAKALELVPHLVDFEAYKKTHADAVDNYTKGIDAKLLELNSNFEIDIQQLKDHMKHAEAHSASRFNDVEDTVEELNGNIQQLFEQPAAVENQFAELGKRLAQFEVEMKQDFLTVERVETEFHTRVGQVFTQLAQETESMKQSVSNISAAAGARTEAPSAAPFSAPAGGTSMPAAGAHDGIPPTNPAAPAADSRVTEVAEVFVERRGVSLRLAVPPRAVIRRAALVTW